MKPSWLLSASLLLCSPFAHAQDVPVNQANPLKKGEVVFSTDFNTADARIAPPQQLVPEKDGQALQVERLDAKGPSRLLKFDLPVEKLRGSKILIEARVKAENISAPPNHWNGIKVMLHTKGPSGDSWPQQNLPQGTFDWQPVRYRATIPFDSTEASLSLGLEEVTGKAYFDDVKISVVALPRILLQTPPTGPRYTGHKVPRLRGTMISPTLTEQGLRDLAAWGANHVRWQLMWNGFPNSPADTATPQQYEAWLESSLKHLDAMLPICKQLGIHVLIDLHTPPGGRDAKSECRLFKEKQYQDAFVQLWEKIARRYKGDPTVWGYDLVNEPIEGDVPDGLLDWHDLALETARRVQALDPDHALIIEGSPGGGIAALANFDPLPLPNIVYSFHMYEPHEFTHQNVYNTVAPIPYPGEIGGKLWNKEALRRAMQPVVDWQRDYNVQIYVGEFSAIRWAPNESATNYLRDCIDLFEENNWDWAYHAFREWPGWSVEHTGDKDHTQRATIPTSRQKLLTDWFAKNQH